MDAAAGRRVIYRAGASDAGKRLDHFLKEKIPRMSREGIKEAIRTRVALDDGRRVRPALELRAGDRVCVRVPGVDAGAGEEEAPLLEPSAVLYLDEDLVAVHKPGGLLVHGTTRRPGPSLLGALPRLVPGPLHLVHRLDRETSGVVVLGRSREAARSLSMAFARRRVAKLYTAVVTGEVAGDGGILDWPLGPARDSAIHIKQAVDGVAGQEAVTWYEVAERLEGFTVLRVAPRTGRRHQIRVHLRALGHPVVGDKLYGPRESHHVRYRVAGLQEWMRRELLADRHLLHAGRLELHHPVTGAALLLEAPLPADMAGFIGSRRRP